MPIPFEMTINAWTGDPADTTGQVGSGAVGWSIKPHAKAPRFLAAPEPADERNWRDKNVGWGLVLLDKDSIPADKKGEPFNELQPIKDLWDDRPGSALLRYRDDIPGFVRRYYADGSHEDLSLAASSQGLEKGSLPKYMLIIGSPNEIPWSFQFQLNTSAFVGRLDLDETGLENYVAALIKKWDDADCSSNRPVVWSVDHGANDITHLMREAIAEPTANKLSGDSQINGELRLLVGNDATKSGLIDTINRRKPALIVTTSHGKTGPLSNPAQMSAELGFFIDQDKAAISPTEILAGCSVYGAIWYAHACCSAGNTNDSTYAELFPDGSDLRNTLESIGEADVCTSPTPKALLGSAKPLRAFVGHVEPTFDWTLRQKETKQILTSSIVTCIYDNMHRKKPEPVGMAFRNSFEPIGSLLNLWRDAIEELNDGNEEFKGVALRSQLAALDRRSMVLLGDPTATIPKLT